MSSPPSSNAMSSPNISIASGTADENSSSDYLLHSSHSSSGRKSISSSHNSPHLQGSQRKGSYASLLYSRGNSSGRLGHQQPSISIQELKQFHASGGRGRGCGRGGRLTNSASVPRVLCTCFGTLLMLLTSIACGIYLVKETVQYRDTIATLEAELVSLMSLSLTSQYSSHSRAAAVVKAQAKGAEYGERERGDSLATIARYLDATYGGMGGVGGKILTSVTSAIVNKNIGNSHGGGISGGGSRFDNTRPVPSIIDSNNNDHNGYDSNSSSNVKYD